MLSCDVKLALPVYKLFYSSLFIVLFTWVRGISSAEEIGGALDPSLALLAAVFCADCTFQERLGNRHEPLMLLPERARFHMLLRRFAVQAGYLALLGCLGYWLFFLRCPAVYSTMPLHIQFPLTALALLCTVLFWGALGLTLVNLFKNLWAGLGCSLIAWLALSSAAGRGLPALLNAFAFGADTLADGTWLPGKLFLLCAAPLLVLCNRKIQLERSCTKPCQSSSGT